MVELGGLNDKPKATITQVSAKIDMRLGGPSSAIQGIAPYLIKNFAHTLLVFGESEFRSDEQIIFPTICNNRYGLFFSSSFHIAREKVRTCEILLIHGFYLFSTLFAIFFSTTSKIFVMPHGALEPYQESKGIIRKSFFKRIIKIGLRGRKLRFLVGSSQEKINILELFPDCRVDVVGIGISDEIVSPNLETKQLRDVINLICYSRITFKKRIDLCIRALAELERQGHNCFLRIVGTGEEKLTKELISLGQSLGVSSRIIYEGFVQSGEKTRSIFKSADIFLLPSENENFAVAVAESIGYGIPVIVSKNVAMHEFVDKFKTGLTISDLSAKKLAEAILEVRSKYNFFRENCNQSRHLLGWDSVSKTWIENLQS